MNTDYTGSNFEKRARELLAPLSASCPASVWQSVGAELESKRTVTSNGLLNKLNSTPKTVLVAAGAIAVFILCGWMFLTSKSSKSNVLAVKHINNQPAPQPIQNNYPGNQTVASALTPVAKVSPVVKKDSIAPQPVKVVATVTHTQPSAAVVVNNAPALPAVNKDNNAAKLHKTLKDKNRETVATDLSASRGVEVKLNNDQDSSMHTLIDPAPADSLAIVQGE